MKIFAFGHQKRVGKDQFITFLFDILRPQMARTRIVRRGFADKLYDTCHQLYGWAGFKTREYYTRHPHEKELMLPGIPYTVRDLLIKLSNKMREFDPDIWLNSTIKTRDADILFISDLRYENEAATILASGGKIIKIERPGLVVPTDEADTALNSFRGWDLTIRNTGDLGELWKLADTFVKEYVL